MTPRRQTFQLRNGAFERVYQARPRRMRYPCTDCAPVSESGGIGRFGLRDSDQTVGRTFAFSLNRFIGSYWFFS